MPPGVYNETRRIGRSGATELAAPSRGRSVALVRPFINVERNSPFFLPIGLLSVAAAVRTAGHDVRIIDFEFEHRIDRGFAPDEPLATFVQRIVEQPASVVGITVLADTLPTALALGRQLKRAQPGTLVVLGGPGVHGTATEISARFPDCVDYLCLSEGETALVALLNSHELSGTMPGMLMAGSSVEGPPAPGLHVDELPFPAYDLVDVPTYLSMASPRVFDMHVGSGCTYKCSFCTTAPFWKHVFSARTPAAILAEMNHLHGAYQIREFNFVHDNFVNNRRYINEFVDFFINNNTSFTWGCAVRPDNVPLDLMKSMRAAGCRFLFSGTDAGDSTILRDMRKMTSNVKSYRFFEQAREAGLIFETNTIIGYPNEDDEALEAALKIVFDAIAHGGYTADVSVLQPLPGAPVTTLYRNQIVPNPGMLATYLPEEAREFIAANGDVFTGFGFIQHGNKPYVYYARLAELIRFFTRHFFRSIYYLKEVAGIPYRAALEAVAEESSPFKYGQRLGRFAEQLNLPRDTQSAFLSVFRFETGFEAAKGTDVSAEIINVYSKPELTGKPSPVVVDVDHEVHRMFASLPRISSTLPVATSYLIRLEGEAVVSILLKSWQRELWQRLQHLDDGTQLEEFSPEMSAERLAAQTGTSFEAARTAIYAALRLFDKNFEASERLSEDAYDQPRLAKSENERGSCGLPAGI